MHIHTQIRTEVLEKLQEHISDVEHFYNGSPSFINIDEEQKAIAVFIDDAFCQEATTCCNQWQAKLNVAIYIKSIDNGENDLDEIAQQVADCLEQAEFVHLDTLVLTAYSYEQDQQQRTWYVSQVQFDIEYGLEGENQ
ncbi:phage tail terminator protein [Pasteurella multocida]|uniref:phage tail terminator protein n=1 Tax=Pasteurella multocida TaxID=747 RepID=UPI002878A869|nr:phage tail terminator protein [Pasteurella multocida]HDX1086920.1 phage tail protein [Pasteurella multocida]